MQRKRDLGGSTLAAAILLAGCAAAVFAIGSFILRSSGALRNKAAYCRFSHTLITGDLQESGGYLKKLRSSPLLFSYFATSEQEFGVSRDQKLEVLQELHEVLRLLSTERLEKAVVLFNSLRNGSLRQLLYATPPDHETALLLRQLDKGFLEYQATLKEYEAAQTTIPGKITDNEQHIVQTREWLMDVYNELSAFLSFAPDLKGQELEFYEAGVLAGLPRLAQLPDNIPTLVSLKQELDRAGGKVKLIGQDAPKRFAEKIDTFAASTKMFRDEMAAFIDKNRELDKQLKQLKIRAYDQGAVLKAMLTQCLSIAAKPGKNWIADRILALLPAFRECSQGTQTLGIMH